MDFYYFSLVYSLIAEIRASQVSDSQWIIEQKPSVKVA
jgi:hypothetical protein